MIEGYDVKPGELGENITTGVISPDDPIVVVLPDRPHVPLEVV